MQIAIIGIGGHSKVIQDIILLYQDYQVVGFLDDKYREDSVKDSTFYGPVISAWKMIDLFQDIKFIIAIGNNEVRKLIVEQLGLSTSYFVTLIHKSAIVSPSAHVGCGTVIMANSVINADTQIGNHVIINTSSVIEHDNNIGNFVHVSPNATLTGAVQIGDGAHIGAAASIIPNKKIGKWSVIGAGSTVISDIPPYCMATGVPAKLMKIKEE